jgi:hypothetical protein
MGHGGAMIGSRDARSLVYPILLILLVAAAAAPAHAVDGDVAPMLGLRFLGEFDVDGASDQTLDPALSFGVMVDFGIFKQGNLHLLLSHQESSLDGEDEDGRDFDFDLTVDYIHIGTSYEFGSPKVRKYFGVTLGATYYDADGVSQEDSLALSASFGGGVKWWLGDRLGIRFDGRGYVSFATTDAGFLCGGGECEAEFSGDGFGQIEVSTGLLIRFGNR